MGSNPHVKEVRGVGLLCGIQLDIPAGPITEAALGMGVLAITAGKGDIIRLVPPLVSGGWVVPTLLLYCPASALAGWKRHSREGPPTALSPQ